MANEMDLFEDMPEATEQATNVASSDDAQKKEILRKAMQETLAKNGQAYMAALRTRSNDVEVVGSAIFSDKGSIIETSKAVGKKGQPGYIAHKVADSGKIVGFFVKNVSANPIEYSGVIYSLVDGRYVGTPSKQVIAPGATVGMAKSDFVKMMCQQEFSFTAVNGKLRPGGGKKQSGNLTLEEQLSNYTFKFSDGSSINEKSQQIGIQDQAGKWVVATEYIPVFGFCNNPEENPSTGTTGKRGKKNLGLESQDYNANYIRMLIEQQMAANAQ